ncbi:MAG UNVERIFIED_CONTAM: hypothetical protein LVT10_05335 [Anaerolineae bacterium]
MGGTFFNEETGHVNLVDDAGYRAAAEMVLGWHAAEITPREIWVGTQGTYAAAIDQFVNGELVMYMSGSWQVNNMVTRVAMRLTGSSYPILAVLLLVPVSLVVLHSLVSQIRNTEPLPV